MEADENGVTAKNTYGGPLLLRTEFNGDSETTYEYMYNAHGDVVTLLTGGEVAATYYYDSFGNILEQTGDVSNSILYAGYQYDEETGLYYINARMYDPVTARFLQADTYLGNLNDPLSLNLYTYCLNNPHKYVDPSGHSVILTFLLVTAVSALLGAGMEYVSQKYIEKRDVINYDLIIYEGVFNALIGVASMGMASVGVAAARQAGKLTFRTIAKTVAKSVAFGAVEGAVENVGRQLVTGTSLNNLDYGEIASSAGFTGVIGGMGAAAGVGLDALKQTRIARKLTSGVKGKVADVANVLKGRNTGKYFRKLDLQFFAGGHEKNTNSFWNKLRSKICGGTYIDVKDISYKPTDDIFTRGFVPESVSYQRTYYGKYGKFDCSCEPIIVYDVGNGKYMMQNGHHRLKAAQDLNLDKIKVNKIISYKESVKLGITDLPLDKVPKDY